MLLADMGAEVIKVEPPGGDPFRGFAWAFGGTMNPPFELDNRGKRSIAVDLATPIGREIVLELLADADVLLTNYRPGGLDAVYAPSAWYASTAQRERKLDPLSSDRNATTSLVR